MLIRNSVLGAAVFAVGLPSVAHSAPVYASVVQSFNQGLRKNATAVETSRSNPLNALGDPGTGANVDFPDFGGWTTSTLTNGINFVSLGFGGELVVRFDPFVFGPPLAVVIETTNGNYPLETALVEISTDNSTWTSIGTADNSGTGQSSLPVPAGSWTYMRLTDTSNISLFESTADGFDVNAIRVNAVPTPTASLAGMSLLAGMGVIGAMKKRRQLQASELD